MSGPRAVTAMTVSLSLLGCGSASPHPRRAAVAPPPDTTQAGVKLFNEQKYAEAEAALASSTTADGQAYLGASLVKQGKHAAAEAPALAAREKQPTHSVAVAALGESLVKQAKYVVAIERMTAVIEKNDKLAYAYYWRAHAYSKNKQPARMVDDLEVFLSLAPDAPEAPTVKQLLATFQ